MSKVRVFLTFFSIIILVQGFNAQTQKPGALWEMLNTIRKEKFDLILPQAMRDNKIDMWIHVIRDGNPDPLALDLGGRIAGGRTGYFIFTDRGGERIERAILGGRGGSQTCPVVFDVYDIVIRESDLKQFVTERDPKRIAVNMSEWLAVSDGLSYTGYLKLVKALGDKYAKRLVSAENLITDFRSRRVMSEIVFYGQLCQITTEIIERAFDLVKPGVTTLRDVAVWLKDQTMARGFGSEIGFRLPGVFLRDPDGQASESDEHIIQGGDLFHIDFGVQMMNYGTDIKRVAYVLREGETAVPPEIQKAFDAGLELRELFRKNIKVGRTAGETFKILKRKLEEAGFIYIDDNQFHIDADPEKTQIFVDFHPLGNTGHGNVAVGPRISPLGPDRAHLKIPLYNLFVFEYMLHTPVPEWGKGKHVYICIEDDVIVTERGVEFLYPPIKQIRLIQ